MSEETRSRHDEDHDEIPKLKKQVGRLLSDFESEKDTRDRANKRIEEKMESVEANNREIGEVIVSVRALAESFEDFRKEIRAERQEAAKWRELHDGQGTNTTHKEMWGEVNKVKTEVSNIKTSASVSGVISGIITTILSNLGITFFGGPK